MVPKNIFPPTRRLSSDDKLYRESGSVPEFVHVELELPHAPGAADARWNRAHELVIGEVEVLQMGEVAQ